MLTWPSILCAVAVGPPATLSPEEYQLKDLDVSI